MGARVTQMGGDSIATQYSDNFTRASLHGVNTPWFFDPILNLAIPAGTWAFATANITANQLVLTSFGPNNPATKRASWLLPVSLQNSRVWGANQFSRLVVTAETGTGSFSGPAVCVNESYGVANTGYFIAIRNGQWRLMRQDGNGSQTQLIAATNIGGFTATIELRCSATGVAQNTLTVLVNSIVVGTIVDNTGTINRTGIPAIYIECQTTGGVTESLSCSSFAGGVL